MPNLTNTTSKKLSLEDIENYFISSETPDKNWKIGLEHEMFGFYKNTTTRISYNTIRIILQSFVDSFNWEPIFEENKLIALKKEDCTLTLEPGGQLELSTLPCFEISCLEKIILTYQKELGQISKSNNVVWLSLGYDPFNSLDNMPWMPKDRYKIMKHYLPPLGDRVFHMMIGSSSIQSSFDYSSEKDMHQKMLVTTAFSSIVTLLFASSPIQENKVTSQKSLRSWAWKKIDRARTGMILKVFQDTFTYYDYIQYLLEVPMFLIHRENKIINMEGKSFRNFMKFEDATLDDFKTHMGTVFPVSRLKKTIETRSCDAGSTASILAQAAFWKGLLYDPNSLKESIQIIKSYDISFWKEFYEKAPELSLQDVIQNIPIKQLIHSILLIAQKGLQSLDVQHKTQEIQYLNLLWDIFKSETTLADELCEYYSVFSNKNQFDFFAKKRVLFS